MKNLLKNKILIIMSIFVLFVSSFMANYSYGYNFDELTESKVDEVIKTGYSYMKNQNIDISIITNFVVLRSQDNTCLNIIYFTKDSNPHLAGKVFRVSYCYYYSYNLDNDSFETAIDDLENQIVHNENCWDCTYIDRNPIIYTTFDCAGVSKNKDFFCKPLTVTLATVVTLEEAQEITTTLAGLTKLLIPLLICLLGLWKALQVLLKILRMA